MTVDARALAFRAGSGEGMAVFCPESPPAFSGGERPAVNWGCAVCGAVLLRNIHERQFLDVLLLCPKCGSLNESLERVPGEPIPKTTVVVPPGRFRLTSAVSSDEIVLVAGEPAVAGYIRETGARFDGPYKVGAGQMPSELTPAALRTMAADLAGLLGDEYDRLAAADRRGQASRTPPKRRHRVIELIGFAKDAAARLESAASTRVELDGNALAELVATVAVFKRWQYHPAYPRLVASLRNGDEVQHAVMTLVVAGYLVDAGNGVGIVDDEGASGRIPDAWVRATLLERLNLEVKAPFALRSPATLPTDQEANRIVEDLLNEAASSKRGQLRPDHSGVVAIGAFHMGRGGLDVLERSARIVLERQRVRKRHLAAVLVSEVSYQYTATTDAAGSPRVLSFTPTMDHRVAYHPGYSGGLRIVEGTPWATWEGARG